MQFVSLPVTPSLLTPPHLCPSVTWPRVHLAWHERHSVVWLMLLHMHLGLVFFIGSERILQHHDLRKRQDSEGLMKKYFCAWKKIDYGGRQHLQWSHELITHTRHTQIDVNNLLHAMACMYRDEGIDALSLPRVYRDICWMCAREEQCFLENILKGTWFHHGEHLHDMDNFKPLKQPLAWWQFV